MQSLQVPATVQTILAARIDRLPSEDKRLLQTAAVIGKDVPSALLQAIAEVSEAELRRALARLRAAELLYETRLFPDLEYTFKHALTHEVAYGSLLQDRRRALQPASSQAIEQRYADRLGEQIEWLAHHAFAGELWEKAVAYLRQAGAKACAQSANREAAAWFERALRRSTISPRLATTLEQAIDLRFDLGHPLSHSENCDGSSSCSGKPSPWPDARRSAATGTGVGLSGHNFCATGEPTGASSSASGPHASPSGSGIFRLRCMRLLPRPRLSRRRLSSGRSSICRRTWRRSKAPRREHFGGRLSRGACLAHTCASGSRRARRLRQGDRPRARRPSESPKHSSIPSASPAPIAVGLVHLPQGRIPARSPPARTRARPVPGWSISLWSPRAPRPSGVRPYACPDALDEGSALAASEALSVAARDESGDRALVGHLGEAISALARLDGCLAASQRP